jgi:hypothetical protein
VYRCDQSCLADLRLGVEAVIWIWKSMISNGFYMVEAISILKLTVVCTCQNWLSLVCRSPAVVNGVLERVDRGKVPMAAP